MLAVAEALETGAIQAPWARALSAAWGRAAERSVVRRLCWPESVRVVAVGGSTLGGSGKTPLAIACAIELASAGARVVLVGHGYRAKVRRARFVSPDDALATVGDEALLSARALAGRVVVAPTRAEAIALASQSADVVVLDAVAQTAPVRASLALLAVDEMEPWGRSGAMPPVGDLRAPRSALLAACDAVVPIGFGGASASGAARLGHVERAVWPADVESHGALLTVGAGAPERRTWEDLRSLRLGLFAALGRPDRVVRALAARGVHLAAVVRVRDHGPLDARAAGACRHAATDARLDLWLASLKCTLHALTWGSPLEALGAPLATLEHSVVLDPTLRLRLRRVALP